MAFGDCDQLFAIAYPVLVATAPNHCSWQRNHCNEQEQAHQTEEDSRRATTTTMIAAAMDGMLGLKGSGCFDGGW
eukprot:CAMPEP_0185773238 /NCGR_PEP_ID=MMETSP1174-20130828/72594_1 /TAXON_ID=35687 /ORGANISM="Dictyocha speculum, Strain CCMP1381" /LENGTH=74 /DNA_ID=CAMNT_0028459833 /DNA_START=121 /DNA_END=342 /DNA_ORIENTATION=+